MTPRHLLCALLAFAVLSACSNDPGQQGERQVFAVLQARLSARFSARPAQVPAEGPAKTRLPNVPLLFVQIPKLRGYAGYFSVFGRNGDVVTWVTPQGADLSLRDGVLVASRGLAKDLMSSDPPAVKTLARGEGIISLHRNYLNGADGIFTLTYTCHLTLRGSEVLTIAGKPRHLKHVTESCLGDGPAFTNAYWIDSNHIIWKSRQWVSALTGYVQITPVNDKTPA